MIVGLDELSLPLSGQHTVVQTPTRSPIFPAPCHPEHQPLLDPG